ncbi:MAG: hypothetical protein C0402_06190 [Thermodesulfovibrio sp.]|nr:hypothetical protein [Thermodesulfovibrio sp.]
MRSGDFLWLYRGSQKHLRKFCNATGLDYISRKRRLPVLYIAREGLAGCMKRLEGVADRIFSVFLPASTSYVFCNTED